MKNFPEEEEDVQKEPEQIPKSISSDNPQNFDKELSSILVKNKEENSKEHQIDDNDSEKSIPNEDEGDSWYQSHHLLTSNSNASRAFIWRQISNVVKINRKRL